MKLKKRIMSVFVTLAILVGMFPSLAFAGEPGDPGGEALIGSADETVTITNHVDNQLADELNQYMTDYNLTYDMISGLSVSGGTLTYIDLSTIFSIGDPNFKNHLKTVDFSGTSFSRNQVTGFSELSALSSVVLPDTVTEIGDGAFSGCTGLTSIPLPSGVTRIGIQAFNGCTSLTSVALPPNLTSIENSAFSGCTGLTSITLPSSVTNIGVRAFQDCTNLTDVTLNSTTPPAAADTSFYNIVGAVAHVPSGSRSAYRAVGINTGDLYWCGLKIDDPYMDDLLSQGEAARISDTEAEIEFDMGGDAACYYAVVDDGAAQPAIDTSGPGEDIDNAPYGHIHLDMLTAGAKDLYLVAKKGGQLSNVLKIDIDAFVEPFDVVISNHVAGYFWQELNDALDSHGYPGQYQSIGSVKVTGGIFNMQDQARLLMRGPSLVNITTIDLSGSPFEYQTAGDNVMVNELFHYMESCITIILPEGIPAISEGAFRGCINLKNIALPSSVTSIGDSAFEGCESLETISLPPGVSRIGEYGFYGCTSLSSITMKSSTPPSVGEYTFDEVASGAVVHVPYGSGSAYKAAADGDTTDNLWYGLTIIEASAPADNGHSSGGGGGGAPVSSQNNETVVSGNTVVTTASTTATSDKNGNAAASFTGSQAEDAVKKAAAAAAKEGGDTSAQVKFEVTAQAGSNSVKTTLPQSAIDLAAGSGISAMTISTPIASVAFDRDTIAALSSQTSGDVTVTASKVDSANLSDELSLTVGDHPVYDFSVTAGGQPVTKFGGNVTVTVPYTPKAGEDVNCIIIYYINGDGKAEAVTNCVYDPATGTISFTTSHFSRYAVGYHEVGFNDVTENAWYQDAVAFASARGITTGTSDGNFSPDMKLTRGQFLVMAMRAYGISPDQNPMGNFADAGNTYYTGYLAAAKRLGISDGVGGNLFQPNSNIKRQEAFTLLHNMLSTLNNLPDGSSAKTLADFEDGGKIASWAKDAMTLFIKTGIINGSGGKLNANGETSRAEMVQVLYNLLSTKK